MCLIAFSYKQHPRYDLVFIANRDEFYQRPTRAAQFWQDYPGVLAGKDLKAGGTWMGITRSGSFAALTNYRDPEMKKENPPSRGQLVLDYLTGREDPASYLAQVDRRADKYDGFNLLTGTMDRLMYYSNKEKSIRKVPPGVHGLSNHLLDTPWKKVRDAKTGIQEVLDKQTIPVDELFEILINDSVAGDEELPKTGLPADLERAVSPIFIKTGQYGTRSSTVLLVDKEGEVIFEERRFKPGTMEVGKSSSYQFSLSL